VNGEPIMDKPMDTPVKDPAPPNSHVAFLSGARAALAFLTRIPCGKQPISASALYWAPAWFPVVGYFLGFVACLVWAGLARAGFLVASVATVAALALVTGAFHEDGLADTADALGGAFDREKLFAILKDSRIGSFGATALILVLLLRIAALAKLGPLAAGGLVLGQTVSRTLPVWMMAALPYATPGESARSAQLMGVKMSHAVIASTFATLAAALLVLGKLLPAQAVLMSLVLAVIVAVVCGWRFHVRAGGITGDFLGATQQLTDASILVVLAASL
jgi:adenosylcobinamide-GDP ribazoletransferase